MRRPHLIASAALALGAALACASPAAAPADGSSGLDQLAWLAGPWEQDDGGVLVEEHWIAPKGGVMLGCGRTLEQGQAVAFEFLRLEERAGGTLVYVAHPLARSPGTEFTLTSSDSSSWTFENPEHDFPKLIRYTREPDGRATAHLEGLEHGRAAQLDLHYRRPAR